MYQIEVLVERSRLSNSFSYLSPVALPLFVRVLVPFRQQEIVGLVIACQSEITTKRELATISACLDQQPILSEEMIALSQWLSDYCLTSYIKVLQTMLPSAFRPSSNYQKPQQIAYVNFVRELELKSEKQKAAQAYLKQEKKVKSRDFNRLFPAQLSVLLKKGIAEISQEEKAHQLQQSPPKEDFPLSNQQQKIFTELAQQSSHQVNLLFGITGSGKSEIYLQLTKHWLKKGKQVLILVPEISLTPQMIDLFKSRLGDDIAIYHSRLTAQQRYEQYQLVKKQQVQVVVGTRSAVFLPFDDLAGIVIDEEHDDSYKQDNQPKYHTRDVAIWRGNYHDCPVILASATPALESYARALKGVYRLLVLDKRINGELPKIQLVDMNEELRDRQQLIVSLAANSHRQDAGQATTSNHFTESPGVYAFGKMSELSDGHSV